MNQFFTELEPITDLVELQFTLKSKGGIMSVIIMPKATVNDPALGKIKPLQLSGSAAELDEAFLTAIKQPLALTAGIVSNVAEYEASTNQAATQTAAAKAAQEVEKNKREAAKKEYTRQLEIGEKAVTDKEYPKALIAFKAALEVADSKDAMQKRIKEIEALNGKGSLFGAPAEEEPAPSAEPVTEIAAPSEMSTEDETEETTDDVEDLQEGDLDNE